MYITIKSQNADDIQKIHRIEGGFSKLLEKLEDEKDRIADVRIMDLSCAESFHDFCWDQPNLENHDIYTLLDLYHYLHSEDHKWIDLF